MPNPSKLDQMVEGRRVTLSDQELDDWADDPRMDEVRTAINDDRLGNVDFYIGWIGEENTPPSLRYCFPHVHARAD